MEVSGQFCAPASLPPGKGLGGSQIRPGRGGEEKNSQPSPGFEPRSSDRLARSQSLYRLSCAGPQSNMVHIKNEEVSVQL
jgi:hypothetical protein